MRTAHLVGSLIFAAAIGALAACSASSDSSGLRPGTTKGGSGGSGFGGGIAGGITGGNAGSLITDSGTEGGSCAEVEAQAQAVPLDIIFMLDRSASMTENYGGTMSIKALRAGVASFLTDSASAGIWATAQIFPDKSAPNESCDPAVYATLPMPWSQCPYVQLAEWVKLIQADGLTPSEAALQGAVDACKTRLLDVPTHKCAVIFVTDGNPQGACVSQDPKTALGAIAAEGLTSKGVVTFAIGFPGLPQEGQDILATIAQNGGTTAPILIDGTTMSQGFIDALNAIRGKALACEYLLPDLPAGKGIGFVKVNYTPGGGGTPQELKRTAVGGTDCGNEPGWYYDKDPPTKIVLCPASCATAQADPTGKVNVVIACKEQTY